MPKTSHKFKYEFRKEILNQLSNNVLFENFSFYLPLFFEQNSSVLEYFNEKSCIISLIDSFQTKQESMELLELLRSEYEDHQKNPESENILPSPDYFYNPNFLDSHNKFIELNSVDISNNLTPSFSNLIELNLENITSFLKRNINPTLEKVAFIKNAFSVIIERISSTDGSLILSTTNESSKNEILFLLDYDNLEQNIKQKIFFKKSKINDGFYYKNENLFVLTDGDLFTKKKKKTKDIQNNNVDLFAEQISTLKPGDFVMHSDHGIGKYLGLESMEIGLNTSDYMILQYAENDKIYVPVYKINNIQKHADSSSTTNLASLRNNKFKNLKSKAKKSIKELAFDLIELQAKRESLEAFQFSPPNHYYKEFELSFSFEETPDQQKAINNVLSSMEKKRPMDHLVCGDVGFGKTEVAMRAAFKAVQDGKQVAILVPTTILALQHFHSFSQRFSTFPVNIDFISRFKSAKESKEIIEQIKSGKIDIIIGTHKLLSSKVVYNDLGLVIVDEEQRFGVAHKEKFKLLKSTVDFLTLTATPIPRTLQLSFLGLRDLSLIQTAPPKRQSIKSYLIKEDNVLIKNAIEKEISRGGQVFIVHNRVNDIEQIFSKFKNLVPQATIIYAHGQMSEKELERRMTGFYLGKYQILIATTIIESGLDIPNANTIIINRADSFGLSQLHQLRGRIGRSDKKAYAYFIIPKNKKLTNTAEKRLKALQTYSSIGSGFSIASSDLEIRGAGDILGASQSGHLESIGLELYMQLLKDAINEIKGNEVLEHKNIEISLPFPAYIPKTYINNASMRLKQYKRLSNATTLDKVDEITEELMDSYGSFPSELHNLILTLKMRNLLMPCLIKSIVVSPKSIKFQFDSELNKKRPDIRDKILENFLSRPKTYQFTPDYRMIYSPKEEIDQSNLFEITKNIAEQIIPC